MLTANAVDLIWRHQGDPLTDTELLEQPEASAAGFMIGYTIRSHSSLASTTLKF